MPLDIAPFQARRARLLVAAGRLIARGVPPRLACQSAIAEPLSDDPDALAALDDEIDAIHSDSVTEFPDESTHFQHWNLGRTHGLARQYRYRSPRR